MRSEQKAYQSLGTTKLFPGFPCSWDDFTITPINTGFSLNAWALSSFFIICWHGSSLPKHKRYEMCSCAVFFLEITLRGCSLSVTLDIWGASLGSLWETWGREGVQETGSPGLCCNKAASCFHIPPTPIAHTAAASTQQSRLLGSWNRLLKSPHCTVASGLRQVIASSTRLW